LWKAAKSAKQLQAQIQQQERAAQEQAALQIPFAEHQAKYGKVIVPDDQLVQLLE
jgi:hypothetical protein